MEQMLNSIHRRLLTFRSDSNKMAKEIKHLKNMHQNKYEKYSKPMLKKFLAYATFANNAYSIARSLNSIEANIHYHDGVHPVHSVTGVEVKVTPKLINEFLWADDVNDKKAIINFYKSWNIADTSIGRAPWVSIWATTGICLKIGQHNPCTGKPVTDVQFTIMHQNRECRVGGVTDDDEMEEDHQSEGDLEKEHEGYGAFDDDNDDDDDSEDIRD